jgi:hypothetical protein
MEKSTTKHGTPLIIRDLMKYGDTIVLQLVAVALGPTKRGAKSVLVECAIMEGT